MLFENLKPDKAIISDGVLLFSASTTLLLIGFGISEIYSTFSPDVDSIQLESLEFIRDLGFFLIALSTLTLIISGLIIGYGYAN